MGRRAGWWRQHTLLEARARSQVPRERLRAPRKMSVAVCVYRRLYTGHFLVALQYLYHAGQVMRRTSPAPYSTPELKYAVHTHRSLRSGTIFLLIFTRSGQSQQLDRNSLWSEGHSFHPRPQLVVEWCDPAPSSRVADLFASKT